MIEDKYYVQLKDPIVGVRSTLFTFATEDEAYDFQDKVGKVYTYPRTELGTIGVPEEVFENWKK